MQWQYKGKNNVCSIINCTRKTYRRVRLRVSGFGPVCRHGGAPLKDDEGIKNTHIYIEIGLCQACRKKLDEAQIDVLDEI